MSLVRRDKLLTVYQFITGRLPGIHAAVQIPDVSVAQFHQLAGGDTAHAAAVAIDDDPGIFINGKFIWVGFDFVEGNKIIGTFNFTFVRDMYVLYLP